MKKINISQFNLEKVKLIKDGGLSVQWEQTQMKGALPYIDKEHKTSTKDPHPHLVTKINALKPFLAKLWRYDDMQIIAGSKQFDASANQKDAAERAYVEQLKDIEITGLITRGEGEKLAVNIIGKRRMYQNIFQAMNSPRIQINQKLYGFENDLEDLVSEIKQEVYEYLFEDKCANPTLFGEDEQQGKKHAEIAKSIRPAEVKKRKIGEPQPEEETY